MNTYSGKMVVVEGPDGAGKSTVVANIASFLRDAGHEVVTCRAPGGTDTGEAIRSFFKASAAQLSVEDQIALLLMAKRQLVSEVIRPALEADKYVICDRYLDSLFAYQWAGFSEFDPAILNRIEDNILLYGVDVEVDLKIVLDCPIEVSAQRMRDSRIDEHDTLDEMNRAFKRRVRSYYRNHVRESVNGHTVSVCTVQGVPNTLAMIDRIVSIRLLSRLPPRSGGKEEDLKHVLHT